MREEQSNFKIRLVVGVWAFSVCAHLALYSIVLKVFSSVILNFYALCMECNLHNFPVFFILIISNQQIVIILFCKFEIKAHICMEKDNVVDNLLRNCNSKDVKKSHVKEVIPNVYANGNGAFNVKFVFLHITPAHMFSDWPCRIYS